MMLKSKICWDIDIEMEENLRRDVSTMCNLSEGIEEKGIAIGEARAEAAMIARMHKNGMQPEQIAAVTEKSIEEVKKIVMQHSTFEKE